MNYHFFFHTIPIIIIIIIRGYHCCSYEALAQTVAKHMTIEEAKIACPYFFTFCTFTGTTKVTYSAYRRTSGQICKLIRTSIFEPCEKASIAELVMDILQLVQYCSKHVNSLYASIDYNEHGTRLPMDHPSLNLQYTLACHFTFFCS